LPAAEVGRRIGLLLNPAAGTTRDPDIAERIREAFELAHLPPPEMLTLQPGQTPPRFAGTFESLIAAGGDGTVSLAASTVVGTNTALGVIPIGTLNHFARDLKLPIDVIEAVKLIAQGRTVQVDVGEVNGHTFVNNSSIGFYPTLAVERARRVSQGMPKSVALVPAALTALARFPNTTVRLTTEDAGLVTRTPFVFIGNNRYNFAGLQAGSRDSLQEGKLQLCAVSGATRSKLVKAIVLAIAGRMDQNADVVMMDVTWARIETLRRNVRVALDGEVIRLRSPLEYAIRPTALKVLVP
jgi:YegS/Rv2252/BmrU family lipid kinase